MFKIFIRIIQKMQPVLLEEVVIHNTELYEIIIQKH